MTDTARKGAPEAEWTPWQREIMTGYTRMWVRDRQTARFERWKAYQTKRRAWLKFFVVLDWLARQPSSLQRDICLREVAALELINSITFGEFDFGGLVRLIYPRMVGTSGHERLVLRLSGSDLSVYVLPEIWAPISAVRKWFENRRDLATPPWLKFPGGPTGQQTIEGKLAALTLTLPAPNPAGVSDRTGAPGRPTTMHLIEEEMRRRAGMGEMAASITEESGALAAWIVKQHPALRPATTKTIKNRLNKVYRMLAAERPK